jgi:hypothetical protein
MLENSKTLLTWLALVSLAACSPDKITHLSPTSSVSILPLPDPNQVFERDVFTLQAVVRDMDGNVIADAPITWKSDDETVALVSQTGQVVTLRPGVARVVARSGDASVGTSILVRRLTVLRVSVLGVPETLDWGDVLLFGVKAEGEGGRVVIGREVALASSNPGVALIDRSGRIRATSPGTTTITATVDGIVGQTSVTVTSDPATLALRQRDGATLPALFEARAVVVNGVEERRETWLEWGTLTLTGGAAPRYAITMHFADYRVTSDGMGGRLLTLLSVRDNDDHGAVHYDDRGDLVHLSESTPGLTHESGSIAGGFMLNYRTSPTAASSLFFRREPD